MQCSTHSRGVNSASKHVRVVVHRQLEELDNGVHVEVVGPATAAKRVGIVTVVMLPHVEALELPAEARDFTCQMREDQFLGRHTEADGIEVRFAGTAIDDQDGNLTSSLVWQSQLTGNLGTGSSIGPVTLSVGAHLVTARATDSDGLVGASGISVLVNPKATTNLTGTVSGSQVTLHWLDKSSGETAYSIERAVKPNKNATPVWSVVATLAANTVVYVDRPGKGNWLYQVHAKGTGVASAYSNQLSVTVTTSAATSVTAGLSLVASQSATTMESAVPSTAWVPASSSNPISQPTAPRLLLTAVDSPARSKRADAALEGAD